jgi:hypothetical protein
MSSLELSRYVGGSKVSEVIDPHRRDWRREINLRCYPSKSFHMRHLAIDELMELLRSGASLDINAQHFTAMELQSLARVAAGSQKAPGLY